jgi:hypothetical protein
MNFKFTSLTLLLALLGMAACKQPPQVAATYLQVDKALFTDKLGDRPAIYFSCIRCGCMVDALNELHQYDPKLLAKFDFYADTACIRQLRFKATVRHSPQLFLDSVYDENYSVMVFRRRADSIEARLIKTEEVMQMQGILEGY